MSGGGLRAVVFDLDGVLVDSEPVHWQAAQRLVAPQRVNAEEYARFTGSATEPFMEWVRTRFGLDDTVPALIERYRTLVTEELEREGLPPLDGAEELIEDCRARGLPIGLCSNSVSLWVEPTLRASGLDGTFDAEATGDEVAHGKPAPDVYLLAAERLGVDPTGCLAIEDSGPGVAAAAAAGMVVVQTRQTEHAAPPQPAADLVVDTLRDVDLDAVEASFVARRRVGR